MSDIETATVRVLMSPELIEQWASRDAEGRRLTWSWGEPDADGFHTPTIQTHNDDRLGDLDAAWAEAEAELPEGWQIVMFWRTLQEPWGVHAAPFPTKSGDPGIYAGGDTPAAALRTLATILPKGNPA